MMGSVKGAGLGGGGGRDHRVSNNGIGGGGGVGWRGREGPSIKQLFFSIKQLFYY